VIVIVNNIVYNIERDEQRIQALARAAGAVFKAGKVHI
jgi:hypothetical protein